ncbi:MAG TPA: hypothetical protein DD939_02570 [Sulfitobacter pontiacus]|nr:hypothetical protein [Sulfitobacter pontiacus]
MAMISAILGICLLLVVTADVVMSTLGVGANGPLAPRVARGTFWLIRCLPKQNWVHRVCGPLVVVSIGAAWIILMCLSWTLILSGQAGSVVSQSSGAPAGLLEKAIYAGHLLSTLGGGTYESSGALWGVVATLIGVSGMVVLTLSVSFVYSTTQAVSTGRAILALSDVHPPGTTQFSQILLPQFATLVAQIKAIPYALYFSTVRAERRLPQKLAQLRAHPEMSPQDRRNLDILLRELPGLEHVRQDQFDEAFEEWAKGYTLRPEEG